MTKAYFAARANIRQKMIETFSACVWVHVTEYK